MISLHGFILNRKQAQKRLSNWFCFPAGSLPKAERGEKIIKTASVDLSSQNCRSNLYCWWWMWLVGRFVEEAAGQD